MAVTCGCALITPFCEVHRKYCPRSNVNVPLREASNQSPNVVFMLEAGHSGPLAIGTQ